MERIIEVLLIYFNSTRLKRLSLIFIGVVGLILLAIPENLLSRLPCPLD